MGGGEDEDEGHLNEPTSDFMRKKFAAELNKQVRFQVRVKWEPCTSCTHAVRICQLIAIH